MHYQLAQIMGQFWLTFWVGLTCLVIGGLIVWILMWWTYKPYRKSHDEIWADGFRAGEVKAGIRYPTLTPKMLYPGETESR